VEMYVANSTTPVDKFGLPNRDQVCKDGDPCDKNPAAGICGFEAVFCLNNQDPNTTACVPSGVTSVEVLSPSTRIANKPVIGPLALLNISKIRDALDDVVANGGLLDPTNPAAGYSNVILLLPAQQNFCTEPLDLDVYAPNLPSEKVSRRLTIKTKSVNGVFPRPKKQRARFRLICEP
jgi:hypothetical protein